jgi:glutathione S-transferase
MAGTAAQPSAEGSVILYTYPLAFNPAKAKLALEEKGIRYTEKKVDLFNGQSLEPWYLKVNPNASTPTLVTQGQTITESMEIVKWADSQGTPLGGDAVDRAFVSAWLEKVDKWDGNLFAAANSGTGGVVKFGNKHKIKVAEAHKKRNPEMAELYTKRIAAMEKVIAEMSDTSLAESNRQQVKELLDEAESILATKKFLAGDEYSAADVIFTPVIYRMYTVKKEKEYVDTRPNVKRYYEALKKRPSYKKVFGVSDSGFATVSTILPAFGKVLFSKATGKY